MKKPSQIKLLGVTIDNPIQDQDDVAIIAYLLGLEFSEPGILARLIALSSVEPNIQVQEDLSEVLSETLTEASKWMSNFNSLRKT